MSLDVYLTAVKPTTVFENNITHNLGKMAGEVGVYKHLWRPEELGITKAKELIAPLQAALTLLRGDRAKFEQFDASNGWGRYEHLVTFIEEYLEACQENPDADIHVSR